MKIWEEDSKVIIQGVRDFHPDHIFDCGQCFRWNKEEDGSYTGIAHGRVINVSYFEDSETLVLDQTTLSDYETIWKHYFDLDRDYGEIKRQLCLEDEIMTEAVACCYGLRILNQEKWETLVSFIISQNNNIPRIKKCIEGICEKFGEEAGTYRGRKYFSFPQPEVLAGLSEMDLEPCRLGYRAKYIVETAVKVSAGGTETLNRMGEASDEEAHSYLLGLSGVGPKVANCISLFSMGKTKSFPVDVWIRRVMTQLYGIEESDTKAMYAYSSKHFGDYGGIAQQYLFYYIRQKNNEA
ncbi:DNA-3-methyladenine glycosylase family protein [Sinanaerobacter chloroacetimidivorans]|jgi:N-glycosylase/DNA lyase|uniref:DNA-(apurinic or apyrimidinic site) lyase n=1 Tax=Sinanaerobacter chloroacetimidivorans TaxID=2818044 RepID=A0A8J7VZN1_9FIRM|nr:DNA glycosylase [Sinanaerobacter chloroacetimidivorans]MBR0598064.1 8-oxoguanine DNA glycosylase [Sinanaerobacter chloroacetimidivorans]